MTGVEWLSQFQATLQIVYTALVEVIEALSGRMSPE
jgi:hypothetical protein